MYNALVARGGVVCSWNWKRLSGQDPDSGPGRQSLVSGGPVDLVAQSRLHSWGHGEAMNRKQGSGTIRKGFTFHKELFGWKGGNGLEMTSLNAGLLPYSG